MFVQLKSIQYKMLEATVHCRPLEFLCTTRHSLEEEKGLYTKLELSKMTKFFKLVLTLPLQRHSSE